MKKRRFTRREFLKWAAMSGTLIVIGGIPYYASKTTAKSKAVVHLPRVLNQFPRNPQIQQENQKPGTSDWRITKLAEGQIQGYASATSVPAGSTILFHVSTQSEGQHYKMEFFRMGYYQGKGARLVHTAGSLKGEAQGWWHEKQGRHGLPEPDPVTKMIDLKWKPTYEFTIPRDWVTGYYLVRLTTQDGYQAYIPFLVRDDLHAHDLMVQASVTTWQAYNTWGGHSYYGSYNQSNQYQSYNEAPTENATVVSYNRPYQQYFGAGECFLELPTVYWLESKGYDIGYVTNLDTHMGRVRWRPKVFLSTGHDEYYSRPMREYLENLRNDGVNLAFLGANDIYWQIRFETREGKAPKEHEEPRYQVCYKYRADEDDVDNRKLLTTEWRQLGEPENRLIGQMFGGVIHTYPDWEISNPDHWLFDGLQVQKGDRVKGLIGWEFNSVQDHLFTPSNIEIISSSTFRNENNEWSEANTTIYRHWTGALVFSAGTICWGYGLSNPLQEKRGEVSEIIQTVTANFLDRCIDELSDQSFGF